MNRRLTAMAVLMSLTAFGAGVADAKPKPKPKPKPITGSYTVDLPPDPTANVFTAAGQAQLCGAVPAAQHRKTFKVPAAGVLKVVLDASDPAPGTPYVFDWDIYLLDTQDEALAEGTSPAAHEEVVLKLKKKQDVVFLTCNLNGQPKATVSYVFTYS